MQVLFNEMEIQDRLDSSFMNGFWIGAFTVFITVVVVLATTGILYNL